MAPENPLFKRPGTVFIRRDRAGGQQARPERAARVPSHLKPVPMGSQKGTPLCLIILRWSIVVNSTKFPGYSGTSWSLSGQIGASGRLEGLSDNAVEIY